MSKIKPGHVGRFNGKIGDVVVSKFRKMIIGRSTPSPSSKLPTAKQKQIRAIFALITTFISKFADFIAIGFPKVEGNLGARNLATKYHIENAVVITPDGYAVDYEKVVLSKGKLVGVYDVVVTSLPNRELSVVWKMDPFVDDKNKATDTVAFVAYSPDLGFTIGSTNLANRSDLEGSMTLMRAFTGKKVHVYMFLAGVDGKNTSPSEYLGEYTIV